MRRTIVLSLAVAAIGVSLLAAVPAGAAPTVKRLTATVGPGFTIGVSKSSVKRGIFRITVRDRSSIHNFHLIGPGVNRKTSVSKTGTVTWTVRLKNGTYRFVCDPHASSMKGTFRVT